jgi:hypothetical protein
LPVTAAGSNDWANAGEASDNAATVAATSVSLVVLVMFLLQIFGARKANAMPLADLEMRSKPKTFNWRFLMSAFMKVEEFALFRLMRGC